MLKVVVERVRPDDVPRGREDVDSRTVILPNDIELDFVPELYESAWFQYTSNIDKSLAMVVAQLAERSFRTPEIHGLNPKVGNKVF